MSNQFKSGLMALAAVAAPSFATAATAATAATPGVSVSEVIVTASKRSQTLATVPGSVQAVTAVTLEKRGVRDLADLKAVTPALTSLDRGAPGHGSYVIRGINTGPLQESATTAFYLDETPLTFTSGIARSADMAPNPDLSDVSQVEILKGPQSTLYGSSALGGLIKVTSNPVNLTQNEAEISAQGTAVDGGLGGRVRGMGNIAFSDQIGLRALAFYRSDPGFASNPVTKHKDLNATTSSGGRVELRAEPTSNLDSTISAFYQRMHTFGGAVERTKAGSVTPLLGVREDNTRTDTDYMDETWSASWVLNYRTPVGTLTNAVSYSKVRDNENGDDGTDALGAFNHLFGIASPPFDHLTEAFVRGLQKTTEELRFTSNRIGPWEFQAGGFYNHEAYNIDLLFRNYDANDHLLTGSNAHGPLSEFLSNRTHGVFQEEAFFANATYYIKDNLDMTFGIRESENQQTATKVTTGQLTRGVTPFSSSDSSTSYLWTLRYRPTQNINLYARVASAYRPGGPQIGPVGPKSYGPDTLWNYEVGVRGTAFNNALQGGVSVYAIDWQKAQLSGLLNGISFTANSKGVNVDGVEAEGSLRLNEHLKLQGSATYSYSGLKGNEPMFGGLKGDRLPLSPEWTGTIGFEYSQQVFGLPGTFGMDYSYLGDRYSSFTHDANGNARLTVPGYGLLSLRAGLDLPQKWQVAFHIDNLTDTDGYTSFVIPGPAQAGYAYITRPRTFSVEVTKRF